VLTGSVLCVRKGRLPGSQNPDESVVFGMGQWFAIAGVGAQSG